MPKLTLAAIFQFLGRSGAFGSQRLCPREHQCESSGQYRLKYIKLHIPVELSRRAQKLQIKLTRLALRALLGSNKNGVVVLVSSMAGYSKHYSAPLYSATKHAVVGFARSMGAAEQVQGVKVVCICPGYVDLTHRN